MAEFFANTITQGLITTAEAESLWRPSFMALPVYAVMVPILRKMFEGSKTSSPLWKPVILLYNIAMVIFSAWCAYGMLTTVKDIPMFSEDCNVAFRNPYFNKIVYWFFMSKYVEFADTLFLIVKNKEVSWLHYLHHIGAAANMGMLYGAQDEGVWLFVALNGCVHTVMYAYYAAALMGIKLPGKQLITMGQLTQFFVGFYYYWQYSYITPCHRGARFVTFVYTYGYVGMLIFLFLNFYIHSYVMGAGSSKKAKKLA